MAESVECTSFHAAIELLGRRWNGVILHALLEGSLRFSQLRAIIPEITDTMLSQRLRDLEDAHLVARTVSETRPIEVHYSLTGAGCRLTPVIDAITLWSLDWMDTMTPEEVLAK